MELRTLTDAEWKELQEKYPPPNFELVRIELRMGDVVFRNPTEAEYGMFQSQRLDDAQRKLAFPNLAKMCVVYPDRVTLDAALKRWPGLSSNAKVVRALQYIAGEADDLQGKG